MSDELVMVDIAGVTGESSTDTAPEASNLAVAFGLVIMAGGATAIGSSVVFFPSLVSLANSNMLAASLGFSAGVMIFVSFTEIFGKSHEAFLEAGFDNDEAYSLAIATFFAGALLMLARDALGTIVLCVPRRRLLTLFLLFFCRRLTISWIISWEHMDAVLPRL